MSGLTFDKRYVNIQKVEDWWGLQPQSRPFLTRCQHSWPKLQTSESKVVNC